MVCDWALRSFHIISDKFSGRCKPSCTSDNFGVSHHKYGSTFDVHTEREHSPFAARNIECTVDGM